MAFRLVSTGKSFKFSTDNGSTNVFQITTAGITASAPVNATQINSSGSLTATGYTSSSGTAVNYGVIGGVGFFQSLASGAPNSLSIDANPLIIRGASYTEIARLTTSGIKFNLYGAGTLTTDASGNITATSDERLKNIQGGFTRGLSDLSKIHPILFKWNEKSGNETETSYAGFSAQNMQTAIPEAVGKMANGYLTIQDRAVIAALVNAVNELDRDHQRLKTLVIVQIVIFFAFLCLAAKRRA
jgi:hypothetical protein